MKLKDPKSVSSSLSIIKTHVDEHLKDNCSIYVGLIANQLRNICADGTSFTVSIIKLSSNKKPFIMCTYPDVDCLDSYKDRLIDALNNSDKNATNFIEVWNNIPKWHIEIDSRLITKGSSICVDNGSQFVAILCHELGHIINTHPSHLYFNYRVNRARLSMYEKMLSNKVSIAKLFLPMFVCVSGLRIVVNKPIAQINEMVADHDIPDEYKPHMIDYVERHILSNPDVRTDVIKTNEEFDNEQSAGVMFTSECIRLMSQRKSFLKAQLMAQYKLSPNGYFKDVCANVLKGISCVNPDTEKEDITKHYRLENKLSDDIKESIKESTYVLESKKVDDRDIILLRVNAENMTTASDKQYVLNVACDYLEILNKSREKKIATVKDKSDIARMNALTKSEDEKIKTINGIIDEAIGKKVHTYNDNHYGLYVKYPDGYEG